MFLIIFFYISQIDWSIYCIIFVFSVGYTLPGKNGDQTNNDADLILDIRETQYDNINVKTTGNDVRQETVKSTNDGNSNEDHTEQQTDYNVSVRSVESIGTNGKLATGSQSEIQNGDYPVTYGLSFMREIAALDDIVAEQHKRNDNLLDLEDPLPVKHSVLKVTKRNFVDFNGAQLQNLKNGRLEYLSVCPDRDSVYVECTFKNLRANGTFKTNLSHTKLGGFTVGLDAVRSNVSASFHRQGKGTVVRPATLGTVTADVVAANDDRDAGTIDDSLTGVKYRDVLAKAVANEVSDSTHRGMVARLKAAMKTPLGGGGERLTAFLDIDRTDGDLSVRMSDIRSLQRRRVRQSVVSMSYARADEPNAYRLRFDVNVVGLKWTSDLTATFAGRPARARSVDFSVPNGIRIRTAVYKSAGGRRGCPEIEADVKIDGLRYELPATFPASVKCAVDGELPRFVRQSLSARVINALNRTICHDRSGENN